MQISIYAFTLDNNKRKSKSLDQRLPWANSWMWNNLPTFPSAMLLCPPDPPPPCHPPHSLHSTANPPTLCPFVRQVTITCHIWNKQSICTILVHWSAELPRRVYCWWLNRVKICILVPVCNNSFNTWWIHERIQRVHVTTRRLCMFICLGCLREFSILRTVQRCIFKLRELYLNLIDNWHLWPNPDVTN